MRLRTLLRALLYPVLVGQLMSWVMVMLYVPQRCGRSCRYIHQAAAPAL